MAVRAPERALVDVDGDGVIGGNPSTSTRTIDQRAVRMGGDASWPRSSEALAPAAATALPARMSPREVRRTTASGPASIAATEVSSKTSVSMPAR
jgi:hypothetical protein